MLRSILTEECVNISIIYNERVIQNINGKCKNDVQTFSWLLKSSPTQANSHKPQTDQNHIGKVGLNIYRMYNDNFCLYY